MNDEPNNKKPYIGIILVLLFIAGFFTYKYFELRKEFISAEAKIANQSFNGKVVAFGQAFLDKVLNAKQEVSFEDRLRLENQVRDLNDKEILEQWNKFVGSKTETEAQNNVKGLLAILFKKVGP